jgi:hypothetical protein
MNPHARAMARRFRRNLRKRSKGMNPHARAMARETPRQPPLKSAKTLGFLRGALAAGLPGTGACDGTGNTKAAPAEICKNLKVS